MPCQMISFYADDQFYGTPAIEMSNFFYSSYWHVSAGVIAEHQLPTWLDNDNLLLKCLI